MTTAKTEKYIEGIGRRKTSVARVRIFSNKENSILINGLSTTDFFKVRDLQNMVTSIFDNVEIIQKFKVTAKIKGGGLASQAESFRLGLARALVKYDEELRKPLKKLGYLKRDPRVKERKKFGLKKARKAPQWSKR